MIENEDDDDDGVESSFINVGMFFNDDAPLIVIWRGMIVDDESDFSFICVVNPFTFNDDDEVVVILVGFGVNMRL
jgi:hypothetical protein